MFEVFWADADPELVGQHREKKAKEKDKEEKEREDGQAERQRETSDRHSGQAEGQRETSNRHSGCASESSSHRFFGSRTLGTAIVPLKSRPSSKASPLLAQSKTQGSTKRDSDASQPLSDTLGGSHKLPERSPNRHSRNEHFSFPSSRDSGSKWTDKTVPTNLSPSAASFAEPVGASGARKRGHSSLITQSGDVTTRPRAPEAGTLRSIPRMSAQPSGAGEGGFGRPQAPNADAEISDDEIDLPVDIFPGPKSPLRSIPRDWASSFKPNNPKAWKTPAEWVEATREARGGDNAAEPSNTDTKQEGAAESREAVLHRMRQEIKGMALADPPTILRHLRDSSVPDTSDSSQYKEAENKKKRWMLSVVYNLDGAVKMAAMSSDSEEKSQRRVLALLESPSTASYLATAHHKDRVYHMSPSPLSKDQFPNVRPITVPEEILNLPVSGRIFSAAYSLSLPSRIVMTDMPHILKGLSRCLLDGATFYLTIIDPLPVGTSVGPFLRKWFNDHLLPNLQKKRRGTTGSHLIPDYLFQSGLRGPGSTVTKAKFLAIEANETNTDPSLKETSLEARGVVGRMLWKEVWGAHVEADYWWWEDDDIVKECNQLNTFWEYYYIEAVNKVRDRH